jgi:hypothetical protein
MNNSVFIGIVIALSLLFASCKKIKGEGPTVTETRTITGFTGVSTDIDADVYLTPDTVFNVQIRAQQNILDIIQTPVVNNELRLQYKRDVIVGTHDRIAVYISAPVVNSLSVGGSGKLLAERPVHASYVQLRISGSGFMNVQAVTAQSLACSISGSGSVTVNGGNCDEQHTEISGSGNTDMLSMSSRHADVHISGSGTVRIHVTETLNAAISGSGNVYYTGNPQINTHISGSGRVIHL